MLLRKTVKLMNNSVFGKTIENIENRVDVRLATNETEVIKLCCKTKLRQ